MFEVPKRTTAANNRYRRKVVFRWRRARGPLERPRVPGIVARQPALSGRANHVNGKQKNADCLNDSAHCRDEIKRVPATPGVVGEDASRHSEQARKVLRIKRQVEPDSEQPEVPQSQTTIEQAAHRFRIPVVEAGEYAKKESTDERVVK